MNSKQLNFAYKVRHALNENLDNMPPSTADRLASARKAALARKKAASPLQALVHQRILTLGAGRFFNEPLSWLRRMGLVLPLVVVGAGLVGIYQFEQQQRIAETAEIDAAVLSDELPLSAYLDYGFNAYLAKRAE